MSVSTDKLLWPGSAITEETIVDAASMAPAKDIWNNITILAIDNLAQNGTLTLTADAELRKGAKVIVLCEDCGGFTISFAGDASGVAPIGGTDNVIASVELTWNGSKFVDANAKESVQNVSITAGGTVAVTANAADVFLEGTPASATTINITAGARLKKGDRLHVSSTGTSGTFVVTFGTLIDAPVITNVNTKTITQSFVWNGSKYVPMGAQVQID